MATVTFKPAPPAVADIGDRVRCLIPNCGKNYTGEVPHYGIVTGVYSPPYKSYIDVHWEGRAYPDTTRRSNVDVVPE